MTPLHLTGWCGGVRKFHEQCDGILHRQTGLHWWCACECHGEIPEPLPGTDHHRAWEVWRDARESA